MGQAALTDSSRAGTALRTSVALMGGLRLAISGWAAVRPAGVAAGLGVGPDQQRAAVPYVYALAGRELVLGLGTLHAWRRGRSGAGWVAAMALSDALDAVVYQVLAELGTLEEGKAHRATWWALSGAVPEAITAAVLSFRRP
jgi:hypothetical protein